MESKARSFFFTIAALIATALLLWTLQHVFATVVGLRAAAPFRNLAVKEFGAEILALVAFIEVLFLSTRQLLNRTPSDEQRLSRRLRREHDVEIGSRLESSF